MGINNTVHAANHQSYRDDLKKKKIYQLFDSWLITIYDEIYSIFFSAGQKSRRFVWRN